MIAYTAKPTARQRSVCGIVPSRFESPRYLRDHPGSPMADPAVEFAIGIGATSKGIDRLEKRGWIVRQANPSIVGHRCWP
jgi:MarR family multiple antibiotic resistance transcriptional regulator